MKVYPIDQIIKDVRTAIDQNSTSNTLTLLGDTDTLSLDKIIESKIIEAVKYVHCSAPIYLLDGGYNFGDAIYWDELESGHILLPEDFMRLVIFKMSDWSHAVYVALTPDDPRYSHQSSRFKGIRGTAQRPVVAITFRPEGKSLEFYSCKDTKAYVSKAVYIPYPRIDEYDGIEICEKCYISCIYTIAALVAGTLQDSNLHTIMNELSKNTLV